MMIICSICFRAFAAVASVTYPIMRCVITRIRVLPFLYSQAQTGTKCATFIIDRRIVVVEYVNASPIATVPIFPFTISKDTRTFKSGAPLCHYIFEAVCKRTFIGEPTSQAIICGSVLFVRASRTVQFSAYDCTYYSCPRARMARGSIVNQSSGQVVHRTSSLSQNALSNGNGVIVESFRVALRMSNSDCVRSGNAYPFLLCDVTRNAFYLAILGDYCIVSISSPSTYYMTTVSFNAKGDEGLLYGRPNES